jgi:hypothetical protein
MSSTSRVSSGKNLAYASSAYGTDQASPELMEKLDNLSDAAFTSLKSGPKDSELKGAMGYMMSLGETERTLYMKPGAKVGYLRAYRANDGYGRSSDAWTKVDFTKVKTRSSLYPEVASYAKETYQASFMASASLKGYFAEGKDELPAPVKKAAAAAKRAKPGYETGVIKDSWQGKFDYFVVVSYDKKMNGGVGQVFGPSGKQIGQYTMTPRTRGDGYGD